MIGCPAKRTPKRKRQRKTHAIQNDLRLIMDIKYALN